ncbi:hypothetical protein SK128_019947, partial [Halocaridina rubra]
MLTVVVWLVGVSVSLASRHCGFVVASAATLPGRGGTAPAATSAGTSSFSSCCCCRISGSCCHFCSRFSLAAPTSSSYALWHWVCGGHPSTSCPCSSLPSFDFSCCCPCGSVDDPRRNAHHGLATTTVPPLVLLPLLLVLLLLLLVTAWSLVPDHRRHPSTGTWSLPHRGRRGYLGAR